MSLRYGFFDSEITGYDEEGMPIFDRAESSDFLALFISGIVTSGVLASPGDCFQVIAEEGMKLKIKPGFGFIKGRFAYNEQDFEITIPNAPTSYKRIDRVILRANYIERLCELIVRAGTPEANPVAPELLQPASGDYYELCLATVSVNSNQTVITQSDITDTRYDSSVCGAVTQAIDHLDTSVFFAQLNQFYKEFIAKTDVVYDEFVASMDAYLVNLQGRGEQQLNDIVLLFQAFEVDAEGRFDRWFEHMKDQLSEDAAGALQTQIDSLTQSMFDRYYGLIAQNTEFLPDGSIIQENGEAIVITVFAYDDNGNRQITQTVRVKTTLAEYVKITTIYPATPESNKKIIEIYSAPTAEVYLADMVAASGTLPSDNVRISNIGDGLLLAEDGTLSVVTYAVAEIVTEEVGKNMTDFSKTEVEEIYEAAEESAE